jgi:hypothetical protein
MVLEQVRPDAPAVHAHESTAFLLAAEKYYLLFRRISKGIG